MILGLTQTKDLRNKLEEALYNTHSRGENHLLILIQDNHKQEVIDLLEKDVLVTKVDMDEQRLYMVGELRISFGRVHYYV